MAKPILFGMIGCPGVRAIFLVAKAIDLELEYKKIDLFLSEQLSDDFQRMNPQGTVPTLDDNGTYLWDSHAIITYLVQKYGKNDALYPRDLVRRARIDQRLHFDSGILYIRLRNITMDIYFTDIPIIPQYKIDEVYKAYELLEKFLNDDLYMVGNELTVADFSCAATATSLLGVAPVSSDKYPKMHAWLERISKLPYYEEANGIGNNQYIAMLKDLLSKKPQPT